MEVMRRSSVKTDLRQQPIVEGEEVQIKLPSIQILPHMAPSEESTSRRSSKENTGSRRGSNISFAHISSMRRGSQARRGSIRNKVEIPGTERSEPLSNLVPMPQNPRITCTMSVEAQYAMLKCYEDRLRQQLTNVFPDYAGLLNRSQTPKNGRILLKDPDKPNQLDEELVSDLEMVGIDDVDGATTARSVPPQSHHHRGHHVDQPISARDDRTWNAHVPHHRQLTLSRRMQMAQSLLDTFADNTSAVTSPPSCRPSKGDFNAIQGYNWWSSGWQEEFQINPGMIS